MRRMLAVFVPPEWNWLTVKDRLAYGVSLTLFLGLAAIGAGTVFGWLMRAVR